MRLPGWENRIIEVVQKHMALPHIYGTSDCYIISDDAVKALTGKFMYTHARDYKSGKGALKKLRERGFNTVEDAFAAKFPTVPVLSAQRGDLGVVYQNDGEITGGFFTGSGFFTCIEHGKILLPVSAVTYAFKVD